MILRLILGLLGGVADWDLYEATELPSDALQIVDPSDPLACSQLVDAAFADVPEGFVVDTCIMESSCYASIHVGLHEGDVSAGPAALERALRSGRLDVGCHHVRVERDPGEWSVRGAHGLMAAYQVFRIGECVPPEAMDVPLLSALAAGRKARWHCARLRALGKRCTSKRLRCAWAMAPLGSSQCGRVIRRWKKRLAKYKSVRTDVDWDSPPTVRDLRRRAREGQEVRQQDS